MLGKRGDFTYKWSCDETRVDPRHESKMPSKPNRITDAAGLILLLLICYGVAAAGSLSTFRSLVDWYPTLQKPSFNPPNSVFGPVWSVLYTMMAVSAWLVWRSGPFRSTRLPLGLFGVQLALNLGWSLIFFGLRNPGPAFAEIVALWLSILATIVAFWRVRPLAGAILIPYLCWVSFASALNFAIWRLNG